MNIGGVDYLFLFIAILYLVITSVYRYFKPKPIDSEEHDPDQGRVLKDFLGSLDMDMKEAKKIEKSPPKKTAPPSFPKKPKPQPHPPVKESYHVENTTDNQKYSTKAKYQPEKFIEENFYKIEDEITSTDFTSLHHDPYSLKERHQEPIISKIVSKIPSRSDLLIYQVIMGKPKGLGRIDAHDY